MAISFSRPDPSSPAAVADAAFGTARRGFDQQEVRDFLRMVAAELARLQERERFLERELRAAQTAPSAAGSPVIDEDTAARLLGEETARVITAAREGGAAIRAKAEEGAARLLREASDEAQRLRQEADLEASRRRTDAAADAEAELAIAKQQGREMVEEARAYRERVLGELSRRREVARAQIEQLVHGRDRLLQAFERARLVAVDVVAELTPLTGPDEFVDLSPTTGPVPMMVPAANIGDASSIDDSALVVESTVAGVEKEPPAGTSAADEHVPSAADTVVAETLGDATVVAETLGDATVVAFPTPEVAPERAENDEDVADEIEDDDVTATDVDDLFARLRAGQPADIPASGPIDEPAHDASDADDLAETPFGRRDAALVPLIVASGRKLKRVLADEQNDVLDGLRRHEPVRSLDVLLAAQEDQTDRYAMAITSEVAAAARAGVTALGDTAVLDRQLEVTLAPVREALAAGLVVPLRERLDRAVAEGDGDNDAIAKRVRSVYREWKTQHIDEQLDDLFRLAHGRGAFAAMTPGTPVRWVVDPDDTPCADCEDNSLSGPVAAGDPFPTGHTYSPSHAGCRCLLVPVDG